MPTIGLDTPIEELSEEEEVIQVPDAKASSSESYSVESSVHSPEPGKTPSPPSGVQDRTEPPSAQNPHDQAKPTQQLVTERSTQLFLTLLDLCHSSSL
jgi:hypothetical protein